MLHGYKREIDTQLKKKKCFKKVLATFPLSYEMLRNDVICLDCTWLLTLNPISINPALSELYTVHGIQVRNVFLLKLLKLFNQEQ